MLYALRGWIIKEKCYIDKIGVFHSKIGVILSILSGGENFFRNCLSGIFLSSNFALVKILIRK